MSFANELAKLEARWNATQDLRAVAEALDWCTLNALPLPGWTHSPIRKSLATMFARSGPEGRIGQRGYRAIAKRLDKHEERHRVATWTLRLRAHGPLPLWRDDEGRPLPLTREGAFTLAAQMLRGTPSQGSPDAIEASFDLIEARNRPEITSE